MDAYEPRTIAFRELVTASDWTFKVYTISKPVHTDYSDVYKQMTIRLPEWITWQNSFDATNDKVGFVIIHAATEGIFTIVNWWVGKNMLNTHIFITRPERPDEFEKVSGDGLGPCVWELEVMNHERVSWMNNIMKQPSHPRLDAYLNDTISTEI